MPAFLTHSLFAEGLLDKLENKDIKDAVSKHKPVYYLGAQGPDLFFFYKAKPWIKYDGIEKLGLLMHETKTKDFFIKALQYLSDLKKDTISREILLVYYLGYICHFMLDSTTHPYIHYTAGFDLDIKKDRKYHNYHKRLESIIDAYMFSKIKNGQAYKFKASKLIDIDNRQRRELTIFYMDIIGKIYQIKISREQVETALKDIKEILDLLYDPFYLRHMIYMVFEVIFAKKGDITYFMTPKKIPANIDFLNLGKNKWLHPCDDRKVYYKSFLDLYEEALEKALSIVLKIYAAIDTKDNKEFLDEIFEDISYSTGIGCKSDKSLRFHGSIFEKAGGNRR